MTEIRPPLPCLTCTSPQAMDVKFALGQGAFEREANLRACA
jgi:hypothetical protein